ncbi:feruloyl-CoA synthase [Pelagimonas varians]|uniref:Carboxylic acid reductase n=1 Tax=Pelagimonas varians TaxID=696760 RepID=A0A238L2P7_9RHOB|nr:feruloyl-CoA synthase [Pelagimonas varians]PYG26706.1 feruloyl-CoA synthase [Pelagimonas varians]SMX49130.1 Carboxylic acid reductase [Pelagimonas varians]
MIRTKQFLPHSVASESGADGTILLRSNYELGPVAKNTGEWLHSWADQAPSRVFLAERYGAGWRKESYAATLQKVRVIAASLLARGMGPDTPIIIMSGNGVDHGLLSLAAQYVGIRTAPVAEQYSLIHGAHGRLQHAIELIHPKMAYVVDADQYGEALKLDALNGVEIVASRPGSNTKVTAFDDLLKGDTGVDVDGAYSTVTPDTVAKILMTSGSTSAPKGVMTTQRMMCVNQTQLADSLPFLRERPPRVMDWLPWNHVFGGSHNFNMMLANGGSFFIDDGKPVKGLFDRTLENLSMETGTLVFNVPLGFSMLLDALQKDNGLKHRFFEELDLIFYAGASLPQDVWQGFEQMAMEVKGEIPLMTSSWGLTETAPATMMQQEPTERSGVVGVPMTGITLKLIPDSDMRCEVRVKGPNVMPGYFEAVEKTADAFDDEGFFITGDAMVFVDKDDLNKGMRFDGRMSEDFKLLSGTWVRAAGLRIDMLAALAPLAADLIVTGQDRNEIGVMIFPNRDALQAAGYSDEQDNGALACPQLLAELHHRLNERAGRISGSSTRVTRAIVLAEAPSLTEAEVTAKGNLNFRKVLTRREALLKRLYDDADSGVAKL